MRGMRVALFKALQKNVLLFDDYVRSLTMVGGTKTHVEEAATLMQTPKPEKEKTPSDSATINSISTPAPGKSKKTKSSLDIDV